MDIITNQQFSLCAVAGKTAAINGCYFGIERLLLPAKEPAMKLKTFLTIGAVAGLSAFAIAIPRAAVAKLAPVYTATFSDVALSGYDAVAYFNQKSAQKGLSQFATSYNGAKWHFTSRANLAAFQAEPAKYAPQYGGYCAWAVSQGYTASGDPTVWQIVNGKLYVNYNKQVGAKWAKNIPGFIAAADESWPKILTK